MRHNWPDRLASARSNLEWILKRSTDNQIETGLSWYQVAQDSASEIAIRYQLPLETVLGVIAALSPGLRWERNIEYADKLIDLWSNGGDASNATQFAVYGSSPVQRAADILTGESPLTVLHGNKVSAFYQCLLDPTDCQPVCIDGHIKTACLGYRAGNHDSAPIRTTVDRFEYPKWASLIRELAGLTLIPSQLQAIIWLTWRALPVGTVAAKSLV